jgi:hypothetical protein
MDIFRRSKKTTNDGDLIDGILDSDEDGPEIFTDNDEDSNDNNNNTANANGVNDTPNSKKSVLSATDQFKEVLQMLEKGASNDDDDDDDDDEEEEGSSSEDGEKSGSDSAEDYTDDEDEGEDGYKPGGYHPVKVGEIYNQRCVC